METFLTIAGWLVLVGVGYGIMVGAALLVLIPLVFLVIAYLFPDKDD